MKLFYLLILLGTLLSCKKFNPPDQEMRSEKNDASPPIHKFEESKVFCVFQYEAYEPVWFETPNSITQLLTHVVNKRQSASNDEISNFKSTYEFIFLNIAGIRAKWGGNVLLVNVNNDTNDSHYVDSSGFLGKHFALLWQVQRMGAPFDGYQIMRYDDFFENSKTLQIYDRSKRENEFLLEMRKSFGIKAEIGSGRNGSSQ